MFQAISELEEYEVKSIDGTIGKLDNFLFDDIEMAIKYLVVNTKMEVPNNNVLVSISAVEEIEKEKELIRLKLIKSDIKNNPNMNSIEFLSHKKKKDYVKYLKSPVNNRQIRTKNGSSKKCGKKSLPIIKTVEIPTTTDEKTLTSELQSTNELIGYDIKVKDGNIGQLEDLMVTPDTWTINYIVVGSNKWFGDEKVLISPNSIKEINWNNNFIYIDLLSNTIINSPKLDSV
jgi:sporulation protein YlmC with PRC-barrel domain